MHNKVGHVVIGDMLKISPELLLAKVVEEETVREEEVVYTLVPPLNNPQEGVYMLYRKALLLHVSVSQASDLSC